MVFQHNDSEVEINDRSTNWRLVQFIIASVILVLIIIFLVWTLFFNGSPTSQQDNEPTMNPGIAGSSIENGNSTNNQGSDGNSSTASGNSFSSGSQSSTSSKNSSPSNTSNNTNMVNSLANTGPGSIVAIFIGAIIVGLIGSRLKLAFSKHK